MAGIEGEQTLMILSRLIHHPEKVTEARSDRSGWCGLSGLEAHRPLTPDGLFEFVAGFANRSRSYSRRTSDWKAWWGGGIQALERAPLGFGNRSGNFQRLMLAMSFFQNGATTWAT